MNTLHDNEHEIEKNTTSEQEHVQDGVHEDFVQKIEACEQEALRWKEQYLRISADFENFKKRLDKERLQTISRLKMVLLSDFLTIVDNFERALTADYASDANNVLKGFEMIYKELLALLKKQGVQEMVVDKTFDPELHEAVMNVASDAHQSGDVVQVLQKGYMLGEDVLRPAKVSIAQ